MDDTLTRKPAAVGLQPSPDDFKDLVLPGTDGRNARYRFVIAIMVAPLKVPRLERM